MIILNFSHPLTPEQLSQVEQLTHQDIARVINLAVHFNHKEPFEPQLDAVLAQVGLSPQEWQTAPILINLPSYTYISALLLAKLHGRMGYFAPILRLRPVENAIPPRYEVAEVINLQATRDAARKERY